MLYRYTSWDDNTKNSLEERYFWFSKPTNFNDPFDCNMDRLLSSDFGRKHLRIEDLKASTDNFGVLCFTKKTPLKVIGDKGYNNLHFWSHYANFHKGISLGFEQTEIQSYYSEKIMCNAELNKVIYLEAPIDLDNYSFKITNGDTSTIEKIFTQRPRDLKQEDLFFEQFLLLKDSRIWDLENEYRIILGGRAIQNLKEFTPFGEDMDVFHSSGLGYKIPYPENEILKEVTFGARFNESEIDRAIKLISGRNKNVKFYKASLDFKNTDIVRKEIE